MMRLVIPHPRLAMYLLQAHTDSGLSWPSKLPKLKFVIGRMVRRRGPVTVRQLQLFVTDEWNGIAQSTSLRYMA